MDVLMPVLWRLDRGWRSFVTAVASLAGGARSPAREFAARVPTIPSERPVATSAPDSAPIVGTASGARPAACGQSVRGSAPEGAPVAALPGSSVARKPAWLLEAHPEPPGAVALAAHLDARRAQAAGLRALLLARQRRYAEAEDAFAQTAKLDPTFDLSTLDGFWDLGRGAHEAAVRAYEGAGRQRDAMLLRATLDGRYRPRLVRTA